MRTIVLTAFIAAALCGAQPSGTAVYIDLSGPWRSAWGDDTRYAAPGFDDSSWPTVAAPLAMLQPPHPAEFRWFRRMIEVPAMAQNSRLALTTGTLLGAYEVYVDGRLIGRSSAFDVAEAELPRPRTFEFDNGSEKFINIAIRLWFTQRIVPAAWIPQDRGPWLLTSPEAAPRDVGINAVIRQKLARVGDLIQPVVLLCLAAVLLLICLRERSGQELLWLVLYLIVVAAGRLYLFLGVAPDTTPYGNWHSGGQILLTIAPVVTLAIFVLSWTRQRWIVLPAIVAGCVAALLALADNFQLWPVWAVQIVTVVALCRHVARTRRDYAVAVGVFMVLYAHGGGWTRGTGLLRTLWWRPLVDIGGWMSVTLVPHVIALAVFALAMTLMQVRRLVRDREEKRRLASELEAARTVQRLMLPFDRAVHSGWEIDTVYEPAQEVGGDFYVVEPLSDGGLLVVVGDVSGKGLKAAMVVSLVVGVIQSRREDAPCEIAAELNRVLCGRIDNGFVTCLCVRLDRAGSFEAVNAGHLAPLLEGLEVQVPGGLPLGLDAEAEWMTVKGTLGPGARLTLMSDGVVEASAEGELFGFERAREISVRAAGEIAETARLWGQNDDITVVTVRKAA